MGYVAICQSSSSSDLSLCDPFYSTRYDDCIEEVHRFFQSYGFEVRGGRAYDPGNEDPKDLERAFGVFDNVIVESDGRVSSFMHCGGDGPIGQIIECRTEVRGR